MSQSGGDHVQLMDRVYRYTRHVYDASRKFYLLGRDRLLRRMAGELEEGAAVLEMGCGTARNLIKLHRLGPSLQLYGIDASHEMLKTATAAARRAGIADRTQLRQCMAEQVDRRATFGRDEPFDAVFFSYSLSMMPTWSAAIDVALANLKPGGACYVVDFCDQAALPGWFAAMLKWWLKQFHVAYRPEVVARLEALGAQPGQTLEVETIGGRYAYLAMLRRRVAGDEKTAERTDSSRTAASP